MSGNVIITCAVTGGIHTPSMSPHLPVTPSEIAQQAVGAHFVQNNTAVGTAGHLEGNSGRQVRLD